MPPASAALLSAGVSSLCIRYFPAYRRLCNHWHWDVWDVLSIFRAAKCHADKEEAGVNGNLISLMEKRPREEERFFSIPSLPLPALTVKWGMGMGERGQL